MIDNSDVLKDFDTNPEEVPDEVNNKDVTILWANQAQGCNEEIASIQDEDGTFYLGPSNILIFHAQWFKTNLNIFGARQSG